jgi:hypothetical protein
MQETETDVGIESESQLKKGQLLNALKTMSVTPISDSDMHSAKIVKSQSWRRKASRDELLISRTGS